jgi:protein SCO1
MIRKSSTNFLLALLFLFYFSPSSGQQNNTDVEIGVIEHLGENIPLDLSFFNEKNQKVVLRDLVNKPTVFTFVYFDCPGLCSPLLDGVSDVIEKSDLELGKDYQVITISFNYNDTPERAREKKVNFLRKHSKAHAFAWMFLTGDSANIYKMVNQVGFKFKRAGNDFIHPACIMVTSPSGKITRYLYGVHFLPIDFKMAIIEAQKGLARPTINRVMEYCFSYDPQGKKYTLAITKISATLIIFFALVFLSILLVMTSKKRKKNKIEQHLTEKKE